jgi:hypothetical protein
MIMNIAYRDSSSWPILDQTCVISSGLNDRMLEEIVSEKVKKATHF